MYFDAAHPHTHVTRVYLDGSFIPNVAAADSDAGWVDVISMNEGYVMRDQTGRPYTTRVYGNVSINSQESEALELMLYAACV